MAKDSVEKGDIVYIHFDAWKMRSGGEKELFDTTHEDLAKEHDIYEENRIYEEKPLVVGEGMMFEGLEESLVGLSVGEKKEVEVPPEKGAGKRNPALVELHSIKEFHRQDIVPEVGMEVVLKGKVGTVTAVTAGRVRVDFNHPLAGRTLLYDVKITKKVVDPEEKVRAIIQMDYGPPDEFEFKIDGEDAEIILPDVCKYDEKWFVSKYKVVADLRKHVNLATIRFVEEYKKKEEPPEEEKPEEESGEEE